MAPWLMVQALMVRNAGRTAWTALQMPAHRSRSPSVENATGWTGFAAGLELPHQIAPASGRLVNANEVLPLDRKFPVFGHQVHVIFGEPIDPDDFATIATTVSGGQIGISNGFIQGNGNNLTFNGTAGSSD